MSAIGRVTRAAVETQRVERGANRIPAVWRARVVYVRKTAAEGGTDAGVFVRVPRLTGEEIHGPLAWVGVQPSEGSKVLVAAVEGRETDLVIINPPSGDDGVGDRLTALESGLGGLSATVADLGGRVDSLPGIEVDTSAGTLVTLGGVPIHYDSGWRDITQSHPGDYPLTVGSYFYVRRTLDTIQLTYRYNFAEPGEGIARISGSLPGFAWRPMDTGSADGNRGNQKITHRWWNNSIVEFYNWYRPDNGTGGIDHHTSIAITGTSILPANPVIPTSLIGDPT